MAVHHIHSTEFRDERPAVINFTVMNALRLVSTQMGHKCRHAHSVMMSAWQRHNRHRLQKIDVVITFIQYHRIGICGHSAVSTL